MEAGIYAVYKQIGVSTYDIVRRLKEKCRRDRIGHGGTLDPLAEGLIIVAVGREYTRQLEQILKNTSKTYITTLEIGKTSLTDDREGPFTPGNSHIPLRAEVEKILQSFKGEISQRPPIFSAVKIGGRPSYRRALKNPDFQLENRQVTIYQLRLLEYRYPTITLQVECSSGTYIRSLARDIGEKLGTGAYVRELCRTRVGSFTIEQSFCICRVKSSLHVRKI